PPEIIEEKLKANLTPSPLGGEGIFRHEERVSEKLGEGYTGKIKALIITSPTYEGVISDIKKIKEICKKYGAYLIVDEAHGALYPFCDKLPTSVIDCKADLVIQSLHKTAGGLNPTALLHCNIDFSPRPLGERTLPSKTIEYRFVRGFDTRDECQKNWVRGNLDLISTTSPSYPLLASIEKNINFLNSKKGRKNILELIENIEDMKKNVPNCEFFNGGDPTKILVKSQNLSGFELSEFLYKHNIEDERANEKSVLLLCGIGTDLKKLKLLEKVFSRVHLCIKSKGA
ncbi:MAG: aminotransferase class V-fold PLP-dependent enzyme, partial [Candidatus Gastranaerophilales bacterium]|nr:aminotransferase class V-fold PLP-dependent enzyme [Candidatus Gastranaerophilales bacterium]